jgi:co-chaperonin GroES (HSP10)
MTEFHNIGASDGKFDKKVTALHDKVVIRKLEKYHELLRGNILVPESADLNFRMTKGVVESIGPDAAKDLEGLHVGDKVLYDHFSAFYDVHPIVVIKADNIICKVVEDDNGKETK